MTPAVAVAHGTVLRLICSHDSVRAANRTPRCIVSRPIVGVDVMAEKDDKPLEPEDFPVRAERRKIVRSDGEPIAEAGSEKIADDVADRLNAEEQIREEDRWSA